jgi:hypothetical protein
MDNGDMNYNRIIALALASGILLAACGGSQPKAPTAAETAAADAATAAQAAAAAADAATQKKMEADAASAAATREVELALQKSELKAKEQELAEREAQLEKDKAAATKSASAKPAPAPAKPAVVAKPAPKVVTVPSGTELKFALASDVSTKSAKVGDTFRARLTNDVVVDGHVAVPAGTIVVGQVTNVVSGSQKIGTTPTISLHFSTLEYSGGKTLPISGDFTSTGKSEKGQDTAKIAGGAAAGAILGHQVNSKSSGGTIIGGLVGAGAGTLAAKKTGSEVKLPAGTEVGVVLGAPITVTVN